MLFFYWILLTRSLLHHRKVNFFHVTIAFFYCIYATLCCTFANICLSLNIFHFLHVIMGYMDLIILMSLLSFRTLGSWSSGVSTCNWFARIEGMCTLDFLNILFGMDPFIYMSHHAQILYLYLVINTR